jgi:hypothetical protein
VAEYSYRHEAEFAAGLLEDAGIPFRLQIDDAGGADVGVTIGRPAVLSVRAEDVHRAREVLEPAPDGPVSPDERASPNEPASPDERESPHGPASPDERAGAGGGGRRHAGPAGDRSGRARLSAVERALGIVLGLALVGVGATLGDGGAAGRATCSLLGAVLIASGAAGRTVGPIRAALRALSGGSP